MKSTFLSLIVFILYSSSFAAIITVDNNVSGAGQYSDAQQAANAASPGDTLHLIGSLTSYGTLNLEKKLTLIGAGYNPPNQFHIPTTLQAVNLSESLPNNPTGSTLMGLKMTSLSWGLNTSFHDITIERCWITSIQMAPNNCLNWLIQNSILTNVSLGDNANLVIRNNVILNQIATSDKPTVVISNNLFSKNFNSNYFAGVQHALIMNNIFFEGGAPQGCAFSTFQNNLTYGTTNNSLPYATNSGSNNLVGVDPQFVNAIGGIGFNTQNDYRLQNSSPAKDAGTDGTDIGLYGGGAPLPIGGPVPYLTSPPPRIPQIEELILLNGTSLFQGDSLQVKVKARKQN